MTDQKKLIEQFLQLKRIAVVGVSRKKNDFTRTLWNEFCNRGIDAIPAHPGQTMIDGIKCYPSIIQITPPVEGVLILTSKNIVDKIIAECISAGVRLVWIYGIRCEKDVRSETLDFCRSNNINVIAGHCPFMFFTNTSFIHRIHRAGWKLIGYYPG